MRLIGPLFAIIFFRMNIKTCPPLSYHITLPDWVSVFTKNYSGPLSTPKDRMRFAISLAEKNITHKTGGPFGAAIFEHKTHKLIAVGMNLVTSTKCGLWHAETVALAQAAQQLRAYRFSEIGAYELFTSVEPCIMCMGAILWSGITHLFIGASGQDAADIGFDEGPKTKTWKRALKNRGIKVTDSLLKTEAKDVLAQYKKNHGIIY